MTTAYTSASREDRLRVPHHPAHYPEPPRLPLWLRIIRRIISFFAP